MSLGWSLLPRGGDKRVGGKAFGGLPEKLPSASLQCRLLLLLPKAALGLWLPAPWPARALARNCTG
eukprot:1339754-Amphidinium_carterae.1